MATKTTTIHFRHPKQHPAVGAAFQACDGRSVSYDRVTTDRTKITCKRCAAKYPAVVKCPTCGRQVAHDALEFCCDDLTRCKGEGGCLAKFLEREAAHAGKVPAKPVSAAEARHVAINALPMLPRPGDFKGTVRHLEQVVDAAAGMGLVDRDALGIPAKAATQGAEHARQVLATWAHACGRGRQPGRVLDPPQITPDASLANETRQAVDEVRALIDDYNELRELLCEVGPLVEERAEHNDAALLVAAAELLGKLAAGFKPNGFAQADDRRILELESAQREAKAAIESITTKYLAAANERDELLKSATPDSNARTLEQRVRIAEQKATDLQGLLNQSRESEARLRTALDDLRPRVPTVALSLRVRVVDDEGKTREGWLEWNDDRHAGRFLADSETPEEARPLR